jgi:hypothetical protein
MAGTELRFLRAEDLRVFLPEDATQPHIEIEGDQCLPSARIRRVFPLSAPEAYISIQQSDGKEVGMLRGLEGLDPDSRRIVERELDRRYFSPVIARIDSLKADAGMWLFQVQTQRGPAKFYVRNWRDSAYDIGGNRWQINSVDGLRFEILNLENLDERSREFLDQVF